MLLVIIILSGNNLFSQYTQSKPLRQLSLEAFSKGDYERAYTGFSELLVTYPKDPLYKYYSGVSLVNLRRDPEQALSLLTQAQQSAGVVRAIPVDALFWLARAQQMSGRYAEAIISYNKYSEQSGKKAARDMGVSGYIQECNNRKGQLSDTETIRVATDEGVKPGTEVVNDKKSSAGAANGNEDSRDRPKELLPEGYEKVLSEALTYQFKADSLSGIAEEGKKNLENPQLKDKAGLKETITVTEKSAASFQEKADQKYREANAVSEGNTVAGKRSVKPDSNYPGNSDEKEDTINRTTVETVKSALRQDKTEQKETAKIPANTGASKNEDNQPVTKETAKQTDKPPTGNLSFFKVVAKPNNAANEKIVIDPEVPPGLIYRIQVAVFRNNVSPSYFKGITPVFGFRVQGTDRTNYYAGMFRKKADAGKALPLVKQKGFKDAFIVSFTGSKIISAERAAALEKEWGKRPFIIDDKGLVKVASDTLPPTLSFRVEVMRSSIPLKDDVLAGLSKLAGGRGLDIEHTDDGTDIYLIGKFITFESAEDYANLLERNGYRDAKVSAWLGRKEIPVETAKQLFEQLE